MSAAARRFCTRWWQYATIPLFAGAVGWVTNKVAVEMIFYPIDFRGLPLKTFPNQPLGWIGWQGIVPAKAEMMAQRLTDMVTTKLLNVQSVFRRLQPDKVATLLAPGVDRIAEQVVRDVSPHGSGSVAAGVGKAALRGLSTEQQQEMLALRQRFVSSLTRDMQENIDDLLDLDEVVVGGMVREKHLLVDLFQRCGRNELAFLVNSGFGFGVALGVLQMLLWLFFEVPWTLALGGAIVGYLTNWIALKLVFEPIEPTQFGPFLLHGMFLRRQQVGLLLTIAHHFLACLLLPFLVPDDAVDGGASQEVSEEFADAMTEKLLSSESLWHSVLTGSGAARFAELLHRRTQEFMGGAAAVLYGGSAPPEHVGAMWADLETQASGRILHYLPTELPLIHGYVDEALGLRETLKFNLRRLTPAEFEGLLHPVFQEDELTLILIGAVLGGVVGWGQYVWDVRSRRQ